MKLQFTTKSILWAIAFVGVAIGNVAPYIRLFFLDSGDDPADLWVWFWQEVLFLTPFFLPVIFGAYSIARRRVTWQIVVAFSVATLSVFILAWRLSLSPLQQ